MQILKKFHKNGCPTWYQNLVWQKVMCFSITACLFHMVCFPMGLHVRILKSLICIIGPNPHHLSFFISEKKRGDIVNRDLALDARSERKGGKIFGGPKGKSGHFSQSEEIVSFLVFLSSLYIFHELVLALNSFKICFKQFNHKTTMCRSTLNHLLCCQYLLLRPLEICK